MPTERERNAPIVVPAERPQGQALASKRARQVLLGQRRALVGDVGLVADNDDLALVANDRNPPFKTVLTEGVDRLDGRLTSADD